MKFLTDVRQGEVHDQSIEVVDQPDDEQERDSDFGSARERTCRAVHLHGYLINIGGL